MEIWQFDLRQGNSSDPRNGACFLDAVSWFEYGTLGDHPPCVCPVIASYVRVVNDFLPDDQRQKLKPFLLRVPGTVDPASEQARATFFMWQSIRVFAPLALEAAASVAVGDHPAILRRHATELRGQTDADAAAYVADEAGKAAMASKTGRHPRLHAVNAASCAAKAAANAASAVYAANCAADSTYCAVDAAAHAAQAANAARLTVCSTRLALNATDPVRPVWQGTEIYDLSIAALDGVLHIGRQAEPILPARIEAANRSFEIARA